MKIPITIGVTGHRDLRENDIPALRSEVAGQLGQIRAKYPNSPIRILSSLATGGDTLCAQEALKLGIELVCPLPMPLEDYRKDFSEEELPVFESLLSAAKEYFTVEGGSADKTGLERGYRLAGLYIAKHCHVLMALWDGSPAKRDGCGTAEAVDFMLSGVDSLEKDPFSRTGFEAAVIHILTPRASRPQETFSIKTTLIENKPGIPGEAMKQTERFNKDSASVEDNPGNPPAKGEIVLRAGKKAGIMGDVYRTVSRLSGINQKKYLSSMKTLSILAIFMALSLLIYGSSETKLYLAGYGIMLALSALVLFVSEKRDYHGKYLQYRVLSETLRAQFFLCCANIEDNITEQFTWTQKTDSLWIKKALDSLLVGGKGESKVSTEEIKTAWIVGQLNYHLSARKKNSRKHKLNKGTSGAVFVLSLVALLAVGAAEFFFPEYLDKVLPLGGHKLLLLLNSNEDITLRSLLSLILSILPICALFFSNYYGKLSLERKIEDNDKMAVLYQTAKEACENSTCEPCDLFFRLAREEIIESGNWFCYCRGNSLGVEL